MNNNTTVGIIVGFFILAFAVILLRPTPLFVTPAKPMDIMVNLEGTQNHTTFINFLNAVELASELKTHGPYTVFAPSNVAFSSLPQTTRDNLSRLTDITAIRATLMYHIVPGTYKPNDLYDGRELLSLQGEKLTVTQKGTKTLINDVAIQGTPINATNGIIYSIDTLLTPPVK